MEVPLTEEEIEFMEFYYDPVSMIENLFPLNENSPHIWDDDCDCFRLYPYQIMMQNFSYLIADDPDLKQEELVAKQKGSGDCYSIGSRNTGKTLSAKFDGVLSWIHKVREVCLASFDDKHVKDFVTPIATYLETHPFCKIFHLKKGQTNSINRSHGGLIARSEHGCLIKSANEKVSDKIKVGEDFWGRHYNAFYYDEASLMSAEGSEKRIDSGYSKGYIERLSGIPDLRIGSPLTQILKDEKLKRYIWRLPQYVREDWSNKLKQERIKKYGGENSSGYLLNVEAKVIEGTKGFFDFERIRINSIDKNRNIKYFEVSEDTFSAFRSNIIVEKLPGTEQVFICSDIGYGHGSPSQILIIFKVGKEYKLVYNISLFNLIHKEQADVFKWLYTVLGGAFIATDATGDNGAVIDDLFALGIPQEHLLKVRFNENIEVGFELDSESGQMILDRNGEPIVKKAHTLDWANQELEHLFYNAILKIPVDENLFEEINGYYVRMTGLRKSYGSTSTDHKLQSLQCFAICRFFNEWTQLKLKQNTKRCWCA